MLKQCTPYFIIILLISGCYSHTVAQKTRVLVVPYTRFQFVSEFTLEEIAQQNNTVVQNVFKEYQQKLKEVFINSNNDQVEFIPIPSIDYQKYKHHVKYNIEKFKGKKYNASNLSVFDLDLFKTLLTTNDAQYIVFINWYSIRKSVFTTYTGDRNKRNKYSTHSIDYDVYNREKIKIMGKGNVALNCGDFPTASMVLHKSLNAEELKPCYTDFLQALITGLSAEE